MGSVPASESGPIFASVMLISSAWDIEEYRVGGQWKRWDRVKSDRHQPVFIIMLDWQGAVR